MEKPGAAWGCPQGGVQGPPRAGPHGGEGSPSPNPACLGLRHWGRGSRRLLLTSASSGCSPRGVSCASSRSVQSSAGMKSPASRDQRWSFTLSHQSTGLPCTNRETDGRDTPGTVLRGSGSQPSPGSPAHVCFPERPGQFGSLVFSSRTRSQAAAHKRFRPVSSCQNQDRLAVNPCAGWWCPQPQSLPWR